MKFSVKTTPWDKIPADLLVIFCREGEVEAVSGNNPDIHALIQQASKMENFKGKREESLVVYTKGESAFYKILLVGMGKEEIVSSFEMKKMIAGASQKARQLKAVDVAIVPNPLWFKNYNAEEVASMTVETFLLSSYWFDKYKGEEEKAKHIKIEQVLIFVKPAQVASFEKGIKMGMLISRGVIYARDLVNEPAAVTTPTYLAQAALEVAKTSNEAVKVQIVEKEEIQKKGMNAFLGVAKGSEEPPKLIILTYKGIKAKKKVVIIGKGITFDTGGLSLKGAEHMETMKLDMAGAAAVLGIFSVLSELKPSVEVVGLIAACENMPSGKSLKPGDILKAMNGKTIEVLNTDAEGRLTLADMLSFAGTLKPGVVIDLATLTGACMVALGSDIAGLWSNNPELSQRIEKAANRVGEKVWRMPLEEDYKALNKSHIADIKNIQTGRYGGAITAALFLEAFVDNYSWAHLDIAGPAYQEKNTAFVPQGGSGFGVRTVLAYLLGV